MPLEAPVIKTAFTLEATRDTLAGMSWILIAHAPHAAPCWCSPVDELTKSLLVAGSLGALVGLERQWDEQTRHPRAAIPAGLRTFTLWALLGTLCAHFSSTGQPLVFAAGLLAVALWAGALAFARARADAGGGLTTAASAALVYLIGGLAQAREWRLAVMLTVVILILLAIKPAAHRLSENFTREDVRMALQFLAITGVILPLVPDQAFGPFEAFNPRSVWLMVVIVSGLGFAGYVAVRLLGPALGIALTGLAGGLASSTATTLSMSRLSREQPLLARDCALAIVMACTVMLWRVEVLVLAVSPLLARELLPDMAIMSLPGVAFGAWHFWKTKPSPHDTTQPYRNPLSLRIAIQFAALYAAVVFVVKAASAWFGGAGLLAASFLSGLTDLDAISLSLGQLAAAGAAQPPSFLAACIVCAAVANSLTKLGLAWLLGEPVLRRTLAWLLGATIALGVMLLAARLLLAHGP